jgi:hypothetical protein
MAMKKDYIKPIVSTVIMDCEDSSLLAASPNGTNVWDDKYADKLNPVLSRRTKEGLWDDYDEDE